MSTMNKEIQETVIAKIIATQTPSLTGRKNKMGDEIVVWRGYSDGGQEGWFVGVFYYFKTVPVYCPNLSPKVFFPWRGDAIECALNAKFTGFTA